MPTARTFLRCVAAGAVAITATPLSSHAQPSAEAAATQTVSYHGYVLQAPAGWRVVDLDRNPTACVLLDRPTVYVGSAGELQSCPSHAVGGAPVVWVQPAGTASQLARATRVADGAATTVRPDGDGQTSVLVERAGVLVSTYGGSAASSLLSTARLTTGASPATARPAGTATATQLTSFEVPGTFNGKGFDACTAPSGTVMSAWKQSTDYRSIGIYIGGVSRACAQPNLTADWVANRVNGGWHLLPIHVGLQAPCTGFANRLSSDASTARDQGRAAAGNAVNNAGDLGIGTNSVIYYDMEAYDNTNSTCRRAVLSFLSGWTNRLHELNYRSGVYSSVSSGISDLSDTYDSTSYARPNHIWGAWWNLEANVELRPYVPSSQWSNAQRVHQYRGGHTETHGGYTLNIDNNFLDVH